MIEEFEQYGIIGGAFGILLTIVVSNNKAAQKRIERLEQQQSQQHINHISSYKEMIDQYVDLVRSKTQVLSDLTGCLKAIKDTLNRMENKSK